MVEKALATAFVLLTLVWAACWVNHRVWWAENVISLPGFFFYVYLLLAFLSFCIGLRLLGILSLCAGIFFHTIIPSERTLAIKQCRDPLTVVQYNLSFENQNVPQFVEFLRKEQPDLVVMQEVSPEHARQFAQLNDIYPYRIGGQAKVGYPSNQFILSKEMLYGLNIYEAPYGGKLIRGIWQPRPRVHISTYFAHPPSPRDKQLWHHRNSMIATIQEFVARSATQSSLIAGDFNLSATTPRYRKLFPQHSSAPVLSWAAFDLFGLDVPLMSTAIDHLWYQGRGDSAICERRSLREIQGSDHYPVLTTLFINPN